MSVECIYNILPDSILYIYAAFYRYVYLAANCAQINGIYLSKIRLF